MDTSTIQGLKPSKDGTGRTVYCAIKDPDVVKFQVNTINMYYDFEFDTLYLAEKLQQAIERAFEAGKKQTKIDFNTWIQS